MIALLRRFHDARRPPIRGDQSMGRAPLPTPNQAQYGEKGVPGPPPEQECDTWAAGVSGERGRGQRGASKSGVVEFVASKTTLTDSPLAPATKRAAFPSLWRSSASPCHSLDIVRFVYRANGAVCPKPRSGTTTTGGQKPFPAHATSHVCGQEGHCCLLVKTRGSDLARVARTGSGSVRGGLPVSQSRPFR